MIAIEDTQEVERLQRIIDGYRKEAEQMEQEIKRLERVKDTAFKAVTAWNRGENLDAAMVRLAKAITEAEK